MTYIDVETKGVSLWTKENRYEHVICTISNLASLQQTSELCDQACHHDASQCRKEEIGLLYHPLTSLSYLPWQTTAVRALSVPMLMMIA